MSGSTLAFDYEDRVRNSDGTTLTWSPIPGDMPNLAQLAGWAAGTPWQ